MNTDNIVRCGTNSKKAKMMRAKSEEEKENGRKKRISHFPTGNAKIRVKVVNKQSRCGKRQSYFYLLFVHFDFPFVVFCCFAQLNMNAI